MVGFVIAAVRTVEQLLLEYHVEFPVFLYNLVDQPPEPPFWVLLNVIVLQFAKHDPDTSVSPASPYAINPDIKGISPPAKPPFALYPFEQVISAVGLFKLAVVIAQDPFVAEHVGVFHTAYNIRLVVDLIVKEPVVAVLVVAQPTKTLLPFVIFVFFADADTLDDHTGNAHAAPAVHVIVAGDVPPTMAVPVPIYPDPPFLINLIVIVLFLGQTNPPLHEYPDGHDLHEFPVVNALELMV